MARCFGDVGTPVVTDGSESEVIDVDRELLGDCFEELWWELRPVYDGHV